MRSHVCVFIRPTIFSYVGSKEPISISLGAPDTVCGPNSTLPYDLNLHEPKLHPWVAILEVWLSIYLSAKREPKMGHRVQVALDKHHEVLNG